MQVIDVKVLQQHGVHYGHLTHKRHPKFEPYILGKKGKIHIINLNKTLKKLKEAYEFVYNLSAEGKKILFVCTKPYAKDVIKKEAKRSGNFYVNSRWLGGTLTNSITIRQSINKLKDIESLAGENFAYEGMIKKEAAKQEKTRKKLDSVFQGIRNMFRLPSAVFIIDIRRDKIALNEMIKSNIPVIAIADSNTNPDLVDYPIPGNDDSINAIKFFCEIISEASIQGRAVFEKQKQKNAEEKANEGAKKEGKADSKKIASKADAKKEVSKTDAKKKLKRIVKK